MSRNRCHAMVADCGTAGLRDCGSTLLKYFYFVSICKYLLTAGLREQAFNVTQLWPGILKFSPDGICFRHVSCPVCRKLVALISSESL